jgi:hypothetical protein
MSQVTSGAETWVPHTHRNHHGSGTVWIFGPDTSNVTGLDAVTTPQHIGDYEFLFWSAAGTSAGDVTYDPDVATPSPPPSFPSGGDPGSVIAWYIQTGTNGGPGPPGLVFDAFNASAGDWIDWDHTNDPFTVTSGTRQPGPDADDEVVTENAAATVVAEGHFPGTGLLFDHWLVFGSDTHVDAYDPEQVTVAEGASGYALAVYAQPSSHRKIPDTPVAYDPWWWLKNSPVEVFQQQIRTQGQAAQVASLIDASSAVSSPRARAMVQRGLYEALISIAHEHLNAGAAAKEEARL